MEQIINLISVPEWYILWAFYDNSIADPTTWFLKSWLPEREIVRLLRKLRGHKFIVLDSDKDWGMINSSSDARKFKLADWFLLLMMEIQSPHFDDEDIKIPDFTGIFKVVPERFLKEN